MILLYIFLVLITVANAQTELRQSDFDHGTYRIRSSGMYKLMEDVAFKPLNGTIDPNSPETWLFPDGTDPDYDITGAYRLGFFAAITIEAEDVTLDLNGFELSQSPEHALVQRFFALIELANAPFPPGAGPADFANNPLDAGHRCNIINGKLGLSSHHSIHGNLVENVTIQDIEMYQFEVAAISVNTIRGLHIENVHIHDTRVDVPAHGLLSQAIFALQTVSVHLGLSTQKMTDLRTHVYDYLVNPTITSSLFNSRSNGIPDASLVAGILVHPGVRVGDFLLARPDDDDMSSNITIKNIIIENLKIKGLETGTLKRISDGKVVADVTGAVFDFDMATDSNFDYSPNLLSEVQIEIAVFLHGCESDPSSCSSSANALVTRNHIHPEIVEWTEGTKTMTDLLTLYEVVGNHDIMHHKHKGVIGLKMDGVLGGTIEDVTIKELLNFATNDEYSQIVEVHGNPRDFTGFNTRGVTFASVDNVEISQVTMDGIDSVSAPTNNAFTCLGESNVDINL